jgi:hypothetical protein
LQGCPRPRNGCARVVGRYLAVESHEDIPPVSPFPLAWHEKVARVPDRYWAPAAAAVMVSAVAAIGFAAHEPLLFASLGPSAYLAARKPHERSGAFYSVFIGHMIGLGAGFLAVFLLNAWNAPVPYVTSYSIAPIRIAVVAIAVFLSLFVDALIHVDHAATEATTILVATGFFHTARDAAMVVQGVVIMAILSELFRRLRGGRPRDPRAKA